MCWEKNILQSIEKGKKFPAQQVARKKILAGPKSSTPPPPPPPPQKLNGRPLKIRLE